MKKINFMSFFAESKESLSDRIIATGALTLAIMCGCIIIVLHSMQGYKWYQLYKQKSSYATQSVEFDAVITTRSALQKTKEQLQEKINFLKGQQKEQGLINNQLKSVYCDPAVVLKNVSINEYRFELSLETKTVHQAHHYLRKLKDQPLIRKARIMHLSKGDGNYGVQIKGNFRKE